MKKNILIPIGLAIGVSVGAALSGSFGIISIPLGASMGTALGIIAYGVIKAAE